MSWGGSLPAESRPARKPLSRQNRRSKTVRGLSLALSCRLSVSFIGGFMAWRNKFLISYLLFWKLEGRGRRRTGQPSRPAFGVLQRFVRAGAGGWQWGAELPGLSGVRGGECSALAFLQAQRAGAPRPRFGASFSCRQGLALAREKPLLQTRGWGRPKRPSSALPALSQTCPEAHPSRRRFPQGRWGFFWRFLCLSTSTFLLQL